MISRQTETTAPYKAHSLPTAIAVALLASAGQTLAQDEPEVEEVLVTGSYIRNSAFAQNSPVDTLTAEDIANSGSPSMDQFIRDLSYTQNTDAVYNVLGGDAGPQTSTGAEFNLRGLGENSTLTLVDGVRSVNNTMNSLLPDIAIRQMEIVLDGGSALYGSDAVAGVVNVLPIKDFEGLRFRGYYQQPEDGANEESTLSAMAGTSFDNNVSIVGAIELRNRSKLSQNERPREWMMDDGSSASGNPGTFRQVNGATVNLNAPHGGSPTGDLLMDPSCGTFNPVGPDPTPEERVQKFTTPSGVPQDPICRYQYTNPYEYAVSLDELNVYSNVTWDVNERLDIELMGNYFVQNQGPMGSTSTALNENNRNVLLVPADHPGNPFGVDVSPWLWRPTTGEVGNNPDWLPDIGTSGDFFDENTTYRLTARANYDIAGSWTAQAYYSQQSFENEATSDEISLSRMQRALIGEGGPTGDMYFNPFGSADPRSPLYEAGVTDNPKEVLNWFMPEGSPRITARNKLRIAEAVVTGEVWDLPAGPMSLAAGLQRREREDIDYEDPLVLRNDDYNRDISQPPLEDTHFYSDVNAAFMEIQAPIIAGLSMQLAARHERFTDFDLESTTPKLALRWEASPSLAFRGSIGESFLAPTPFQARPFVPDENCGEAFSGNDPFFDQTLVGAASCQSGNPSLSPEKSTIKNLGMTWEPGGTLNGLSVSLDYQQVEYEDRIRTLDDTDAVFAQFDDFLDQQGMSAESYDSSPGSADRQAAEQYLRSIAGVGNPVQRNPETLEVQTIFTQAANISSVYVDLLDLQTSYSLNTTNLGTFTADLSSSYYVDYRYKDLNEIWVDAVGKQNHPTGIVPPIPKLKTTLRLDWLQGPHNASLTTNYRHHVLYDGRGRDNYNDGWLQSVDSHIDAEEIVDARYSYTFEDLLSSRVTLTAGINNLFDRRPERLPIQGGFETRLSVPWGRQIWMSLTWQP